MQIDSRLADKHADHMCVRVLTPGCLHRVLMAFLIHLSRVALDCQSKSIFTSRVYLYTRNTLDIHCAFCRCQHNPSSGGFASTKSFGNMVLILRCAAAHMHHINVHIPTCGDTLLPPTSQSLNANHPKLASERKRKRNKKK